MASFLNSQYSQVGVDFTDLRGRRVFAKPKNRRKAGDRLVRRKEEQQNSSKDDKER